MPTCLTCGKWKPDKQFRLWKRQRYDVPMLTSICMSCELSPKIHCFLCGGALDWYEVHKEGELLVLCKVCYQKELQYRKYIEVVKLIKKIKNIILKLQKMSANSIDDLRTVLFRTIDNLESGKITPDVANKVIEVARVIIDTARAENEFIQLTGSGGSGFIPLRTNEIKQLGQ